MFVFTVFTDSTRPISELQLEEVSDAAGTALTGRVFRSTGIDPILRAQAILLRMGAKLSFVDVIS